jgi:hypothetical protein
MQGNAGQDLDSRPAMKEIDKEENKSLAVITSPSYPHQHHIYKLYLQMTKQFFLLLGYFL